MEETTALRVAIERLYAAFAVYPLRDDTNACACCHSKEDEKRLHRKQLREIGSAELQQYANDALLAWGDVSDFKHFLPRIFELTVAHGAEFLDPQAVFKKLYHGEWRYWPETEQRAVEHFFDVLWNCALESQPQEATGEEIEDWLCGIAQAVSRLSPFLNRWLTTETENARLNLAGFIAYTDFANLKCHASGYWADRAELFDEIVTWLRSDEVKAKMVIIASDFPQCDFVERAYISLP
jgi:hypothetical protein